jgi:hypothetical protein
MMIFDMTTSTFTCGYVLLSLVGSGSGCIVLKGDNMTQSKGGEHG